MNPLQTIMPSFMQQSPAVAASFPQPEPQQPQQPQQQSQQQASDLRPEPGPVAPPTISPAPEGLKDLAGTGSPTRPTGTMAFQGGFTGGPPVPSSAATGPVNPLPQSRGFSTIGARKPSGFQAI